MATAKTKTAAEDITSNIEQTVEHIRELNEQVIESAKKNGLTALDAYEKSLASLVDFEQKIAEASPLEWVSALANAHAKFVADVSGAFTSAARDALK